MLLLLMLGIFLPAGVGALGWMLYGLSRIPAAWRVLGRPSGFPLMRKEGAWPTLGLLGISVASISLTLGFPHESTYVGRDQGIYFNHALHLAREGHLHLRQYSEIQMDGQLAAGKGLRLRSLF